MKTAAKIRGVPWRKGQSGNPGGRPKALVDVVELARSRTQTNIANLAYWADQREEGAIAVKASLALHEIAWGKPAQCPDLNGSIDTGMDWLLQKIRQSAPKP